MSASPNSTKVRQSLSNTFQGWPNTKRRQRRAGPVMAPVVPYGRHTGAITGPARRLSSSALHLLNQNLRRLRPHHALIRQFAVAEFLAQIAAADGDLLETLRAILIHQAHAAKFGKVGGEADFHRLDQQFAFEFIELALGGQTVPDVFAVVIRGVGMLAADDDIGEAEVLPVDGVHNRLLRPGVKHLDVEAEEDKLVGQVVAGLFPKLLIFITLTDGFVVDERAIGSHASEGIYIIALRLADERVEDRASKVPGPGEPLQANHKCVLVGAVESIASLKRHHALPALPLE